MLSESKVKGVLLLKDVFLFSFDKRFFKNWDGEPLVAQMVKKLPAMKETGVRFLGQEDPLEKGTATHSSIPAWRILWTEEPGRLQSMGLQRVGHDWGTKDFKNLKLLKKNYDTKSGQGSQEWEP